MNLNLRLLNYFIELRTGINYDEIIVIKKKQVYISVIRLYVFYSQLPMLKCELSNRHTINRNVYVRQFK